MKIFKTYLGALFWTGLGVRGGKRGEGGPSQSPSMFPLEYGNLVITWYPIEAKKPTPMHINIVFWNAYASSGFTILSPPIPDKNAHAGKKYIKVSLKDKYFLEFRFLGNRKILQKQDIETSPGKKAGFYKVSFKRKYVQVQKKIVGIKAATK